MRGFCYGKTEFAREKERVLPHESSVGL